MGVVFLLLIAVLLTGCGAQGSDPCDALTRLEALDARFTEGDIMQALRDNDIDAFATLLDAAAAEASTVRDGLEGATGEAAEELTSAATGFIRAANLFEAAFTAATIRQENIEDAGDDLAEARSHLVAARSQLGDC